MFVTAKRKRANAVLKELTGQGFLTPFSAFAFLSVQFEWTLTYSVKYLVVIDVAEYL